MTCCGRVCGSYGRPVYIQLDSIRQNKFFRDTDKATVESRLGNILIDLYEESEVIRIAREAREEAERKRKEKERLREERRKQYKSNGL